MSPTARRGCQCDPLHLRAFSAPQPRLSGSVHRDRPNRTWHALTPPWTKITCAENNRRGIKIRCGFAANNIKVGRPDARCDWELGEPERSSIGRRPFHLRALHRCEDRANADQTPIQIAVGVRSTASCDIFAGCCKIRLCRPRGHCGADSARDCRRSECSRGSADDRGKATGGVACAARRHGRSCDGAACLRLWRVFRRLSARRRSQSPTPRSTPSAMVLTRRPPNALTLSPSTGAMRFNRQRNGIGCGAPLPIFHRFALLRAGASTLPR